MWNQYIDDYKNGNCNHNLKENINDLVSLNKEIQKLQDIADKQTKEEQKSLKKIIKAKHARLK